MNEAQREVIRREIKEKGGEIVAKAAGVVELTLYRVLEDVPTVNMSSVRLVEHLADDLLRQAATGPEGDKGAA